MTPDPSTDRPTTPEDRLRSEERKGAAVGIFASLGCLGYALIMVVVVLGLLAVAWLLGLFSPPAGTAGTS